MQELPVVSLIFLAQTLADPAVVSSIARSSPTANTSGGAPASVAGDAGPRQSEDKSLSKTSDAVGPLNRASLSGACT